MWSKPRSLGVYTNGGYASHVLVPDSQYLLNIDGPSPMSRHARTPVPDSLPNSALKKSMPLEWDETLVLIGAGGLGYDGRAGSPGADQLHG